MSPDEVWDGEPTGAVGKHPGEVWDYGPTMAPGKRYSTDEPLTEHDVAERIDKAAMRLLKILMDARQLDLMEQVKLSRYMRGSLPMLAYELTEHWGVEPHWPKESTEPVAPTREDTP